jgi:type II restriction/modification system DNA methylase subunit YeeA
MGDTKGGAFDVPGAVAAKLLGAPLNPNGRPNADVVLPWVNGLDITRRPRGMSIIDFGVSMPAGEAALYEQPFEHVRHHVKPERAANSRAAYRNRWWLHVEPRPAMRKALAPLRRFIGTPTVSKHRLFVWLEHPTLPDHQLIVVARQDDYFFGVLHSKLHELWALQLGTSLEDRPRYTHGTTFETFPFPWPPGREPANDMHAEAIADASRVLVHMRDAWLNPPDADEEELKLRTLTKLYNAQPTWLLLAHSVLDRAVLDAYGWPHNLPYAELLERLFALNRARAAADIAAGAQPLLPDPAVVAIGNAEPAAALSTRRRRPA